MSAQWLMFKLKIHSQTSLVSQTANVYEDDSKIHMLVPDLTLYIDIAQLRSIVLYIHVHVYPKTHFKTTMNIATII